MDIITIEGAALADLIDALSTTERPRRLRVAIDVDGLKLKVDEGIWSPPYPVAAEDVRRRAAREALMTRGMQFGDGGTQTNYF